LSKKEDSQNQTYGRFDGGVARAQVIETAVALYILLTGVADDAFTRLKHAFIGSLVIEGQLAVNTAVGCAAPET
jgi:hypothetical protein